jgi:hypothetical protein
MRLNKMREDLKINPNKFHNFMVYEAIKRILSMREFDLNLTSLMERAYDRDPKSPFFIRAQQTPTISLNVALKMATHWQVITKQYIYTLLISLGKLADTVCQLDLPSEYTINALQTGITVLSDDLDFVLEEDAPSEPDGMSPLWWEANIVRPFLRASNRKAEVTVTPKVQRLLQCMNELGETPLGFAVLLRGAESMGMDMVLFLLALFLKVEVKGQKIFKSSEVLNWIGAHLEDKSFETRKTVYKESDTINIGRVTDQDLSHLAEEYINCWKEALDELYGFLNGGLVTEDCAHVVCHLL